MREKRQYGVMVLTDYGDAATLTRQASGSTPVAPPPAPPGAGPLAPPPLPRPPVED